MNNRDDDFERVYRQWLDVESRLTTIRDVLQPIVRADPDDERARELLAQVDTMLDRLAVWAVTGE